jgi:hypothetical protein
MKNLWILTEERPKANVIENIVSKFCLENGFEIFIEPITFLPVILEDKFDFTYEVIGIVSASIDKILIKTVSGKSSFVDFMIYYQDELPNQDDIPQFLIEETKTDDSESRNTGVYQRASKFVYAETFYPNAKKIILYNIQVSESKSPTDTNIFGSKCLSTIGVEILGKTDYGDFNKFNTYEELIDFNQKIKQPPYGIPIKITLNANSIEVSGRLIKSDSLSYDPNIGALTLISSALRKLGWKKDIIITKHGLSQRHISPKNKFIRIANAINIKLDGLIIPKSPSINYWYYDKSGEKLGTIFVHLLVENFSNGKALFENHAGSEKGYFTNADGVKVALEKYSDRKLYKAGDKSKIIQIPDLVLIDFENKEILNIEGEKSINLTKGLEQIKGFDTIEDLYIKPNYPEYNIQRRIVLFGGDDSDPNQIAVAFRLSTNGKLILGDNPPMLFIEAMNKLNSFSKNK